MELKHVGSLEVIKLCRDWRRVPVTDEVRHPDLADLERRFGLSGERREILERLLHEQEIGDLRPSYDEMMFDDAGRLWVRTVGPEVREYHPWIANLVPELSPPIRSWDVYETSGGLLWTVRLPSVFQPRVVSDSSAFGFLELDSGEIVIGEARLRTPPNRAGETPIR